MGMKRFVPAALLLWSTTPALAHSQHPTVQVEQAVDKELWITLGAEAVGPVQASFWQAGLQPPLQAHVSYDVAVMRVRESQLALISEVMHDTFNRCAGFIAHDTEQEALAAAAQYGKPSEPKAQVAYTVDNAAVVNALVGELREANIRGTITSLSGNTTRYYTSTGGVNAANWLKAQWETLAQGRSDVSVAFFNHAAYAQPSVILTIQGATLPNEVVVLGGHLDSTNRSGSTLTAPGADDDASGIASLTEVIRAAMAKGYRPSRTVKFMAYAAEEVGLRGSNEIATWHKNNLVNVVGVLQLDMTNYRGSNVDIGLLTDNTNAAQNAFLTSVIDTYALATWANTACGYGCSDHVSWHNNGFAASMPFEALMNQHNSAIHTTNDTLAQVGGTANHALKFSKVAAAYMAELAKGTANVPPPDTTPPTVALTSPGDGATLSGTFNLAASASDDVGVTRVEFFINGTSRGTDTSAPYSYAWDTNTTPNGSYTLSARAYDAAGNSSASASVQVTVSNTLLTAVYNATLRAPACTSVGSLCDSGTLLDGRNNLGPEPNWPNTLNNSCADGASGRYHSDESNDRIRVYTTDGTPFAPGKTVRIEATVWAFSTTADKLDLYYTANANSPSWTYLTTLAPTAKGALLLSTTYTLPTGTLQAVRARFRYSGSATPCGSGSYNDHDDLAFAVQP